MPSFVTPKDVYLFVYLFDSIVFLPLWLRRIFTFVTPKDVYLCDSVGCLPQRLIRTDTTVSYVNFTWHGCLRLSRWLWCWSPRETVQSSWPGGSCSPQSCTTIKIFYRTVSQDFRPQLYFSSFLLRFTKFDFYGFIKYFINCRRLSFIVTHWKNRVW